MAIGRSQPSLVMDVQVLVTHASSVATMEREMGNPPRLICTPDVCYLFHARDEARLPGLVDRWASYGIAAQVVRIPPTGEPSSRDSHPTPSSCQEQVGRDTGNRADLQDRSAHGANCHRRDTHELSHRPRPQGARPDRTPLNRYTGGRRSSGYPARDGGLL
jgi:hypothetical protein